MGGLFLEELCLQERCDRSRHGGATDAGVPRDFRARQRTRSLDGGKNPSLVQVSQE
jgi:hypothetical protein